MVTGEQTVIENPNNKQFRIAGITQHRMTRNFEPDPVPRDPQKAHLGNTAKMPRKGFVRFLLVNMLQPERSDKNGLLGYLIHAHCWVLLDRVIGHKLVEQKLGIFADAIKRFWKENRVLWTHDRFDYNYDDPFYPLQNRLRKKSSITEFVRSERDLQSNITDS